MSRYLISRIEGCANITMKPFTEIESLEGNGHLQRTHWRTTKTGERFSCNVQHLFLMTGACPNTQWLDGCVELDAKQFIKTGVQAGEKWTMGRPPYMLETSLPGVFAVGDVRAGSLKRVAAAVGEGSMAVQFVHKVLSE
jgi:thioredoxin reductase (NADPH)